MRLIMFFCRAWRVSRGSPCHLVGRSIGTGYPSLSWEIH